ncbi:MAG: hypothetical protein PHS45_00715 [Bacilli bacterium]|nr:hypothetical protein [Bacilli bacterium]
MLRKDINKKYDLNIIYNGAVYQKLLSKVALKELDKKYYYDQTFETEYHLLKHLVEEYDVKLPNNSLDGTSVEFNYYADKERKTIYPLYENDYIEPKNIIEMAGYLSIILPHVYKDLIKIYREDPKCIRQIKDAEDMIGKFNKGIKTRKKNLEILADRRTIIEQEKNDLKNKDKSKKNIDNEKEENDKLPELKEALQSVNHMYEDTLYDLEVCTISRNGRMQGLFNVLYKNATYEELRYAYCVMKPFRAYFNQWKKEQEQDTKKK